MDFTKDDLHTQLKQMGYSEKEQTVLIWEGVTYYIQEAGVRDTLRFVRDHSKPGSTIASDYLRRSAASMKNNPGTELNARWGEPYVFGLPDEGAASFVREEGLEVVSDTPNSMDFYQLLYRSDGAPGIPGFPQRPERPSQLPSNRGRCLARVPVR